MSKRWPAAALLLIVVVLTWLSFKHLAAGVYYQRADTLFTQWSKTGKVDHLQEWEFATDLAARGLAMTPHNPELLSLSARLNLLYGGTASPDWGFYTELIEQSEVQTRRALDVRPEWPYDWVLLATLMGRRGEIGPEFEAAVTKAVTLGPYEELAQQQVLVATLFHWPRLNASVQSLLVDMVARGVNQSGRQAQLLFRIIGQYGLTQTFCDELRTSVAEADFLSRHCSA